MIYIFGSAVRNEPREDSDIEIDFLANEKVTDYESFMLHKELADIFKREVDLINLKTASTVIKAQIIGNGRAIYVAYINVKIDLAMRIISIKRLGIPNNSSS